MIHRSMYFSVKGTDLSVNFSSNSTLNFFDKNKQISIFDSPYFLGNMTGLLSIYLISLLWILISSVDYHRQDFNDTYTQVLFSIILNALNFVIGAISLGAIYVVQKIHLRKK